MESIRYSVKNNSLPDLHNYLHAILEDRDEYVNKLGEAISLLHEIDAPREVVVSVLSQWDMTGDEDPDNSFITAAENFVCSNEDLRFLVKRVETFSDIRYMISQIMDNISFGQVINRLLYAYEDIMTNDDLLDLKEHLDVYESKTKKKLPSVMNYIDRNIKLKAKKPDYVSIKDGESKSYLDNVSIGLDMEENEVFMNQVKEESQKLIKGDVQKFVDMFASSMSDIVDKDNSFDKSFRVWGPENRFLNRDCSGNPEGKGPCRMFNCLCRDSEENDGEIIYDWFTGKCDHCNRQISNRSHAVRYPHKEGGWKGCYCCFYCVSQLPPYQTNKEDNVRMKHVETRLKEVGIMDRSLL